MAIRPPDFYRSGLHRGPLRGCWLTTNKNPQAAPTRPTTPTSIRVPVAWSARLQQAVAGAKEHLHDPPFLFTGETHVGWKFWHRGRRPPEGSVKENCVAPAPSLSERCLARAQQEKVADDALGGLGGPAAARFRLTDAEGARGGRRPDA